MDPVRTTGNSSGKEEEHAMPSGAPRGNAKDLGPGGTHASSGNHTAGSAVQRASNQSLCLLCTSREHPVESHWPESTTIV